MSKEYTMLTKRITPKSQNEMIRIGKKIYDKNMTIAQAAVRYNVNYYTARNWLRIYKARKLIEDNN